MLLNNLKIKEISESPLFFTIFLMGLVLAFNVLICVLDVGYYIRRFTMLINFTSGDLWLTLKYSSGLEPYNPIIPNGFPYPPLCVVVYYLISRIDDIAIYNNHFNISNYFIYIYLIMQLLCCLFIFCFNLKSSYKRFSNYNYAMIFSGLLLFNHPMLYALERGNTILVSFIFLIFFLENYNSNSKVLSELSLISLAVSANFKLYMALFGLLLLNRKYIKNGIRCILYGIVLFIVPFFFLKGGFVYSFKAFFAELLSWSFNSGINGNICIEYYLSTISKLLNSLFDNNANLLFLSLPIKCVVFVVMLFMILHNKKLASKCFLIVTLIFAISTSAFYTAVLYIVPICYLVKYTNKLTNFEKYITVVCIASIMPSLIPGLFPAIQLINLVVCCIIGLKKIYSILISIKPQK